MEGIASLASISGRRQDVELALLRRLGPGDAVEDELPELLEHALPALQPVGRQRTSA